MYFDFFPQTYYTLDNGNSVQVVTNIFLRAVINEQTKSNLTIYDKYDIQDGETPDIVAHKFYGFSGLHWLVLHINDILDPRFGWPLSNYGLIEYVNSKYENPQGIHHYEDSNGRIVDVSGLDEIPVIYYPVSNFMYEDRLNESKRQIKMLKPEFVNKVVSEFRDKIRA